MAEDRDKTRAKPHLSFNEDLEFTREKGKAFSHTQAL